MEKQYDKKCPMINNKVYLDYKDNILVDKDNSILVFKADRDKYPYGGNQEIYAGLSHLGSVNSEDAITWNLIRSLSLTDDFSPFENLLKIKLENPKVLLWNLSFDTKSDELQHVVASTIQETDGKYDRQTTEPDIIIETESHIIVIECKLGESDKYPAHLWESSKNSPGPRLREKDYFKSDLFIGNSGYFTETYQLYRMAFYANELGHKLNKRPLLVSLTNESWWNKRKRNRQTPAEIWKSFTNQVNESKIDLLNIFWQDLKIENDEILASYLQNHRCLQIY